MSTNTLVNKLMGLTDDLIGGSSLMWRYHHQVGSHAHTQMNCSVALGLCGVVSCRVVLYSTADFVCLVCCRVLLTMNDCIPCAVVPIADMAYCCVHLS
jgi:hypothetical protein